MLSEEEILEIAANNSTDVARVKNAYRNAINYDEFNALNPTDQEAVLNELVADRIGDGNIENANPMIDKAKSFYESLLRAIEVSATYFDLETLRYPDQDNEESISMK